MKQAGKNMEKNPHENHRKRVREEFLAHGFDESTPLHKVVEMLLFYCIPRKDTNELAHAVVDKFKTLENILEASHEELKEIEGLGDNAVAFFKLLTYITSVYRSERIVKRTKFKTLTEVTDFLFAKYLNRKTETFAVTTFNSSGNYIAFDIVNEGDVSSVGISIREIVEVVCKRKASAVIISHNHPGGNALPSPDDTELTKRIINALAQIDVTMIDHIIISEDDYVSLRQSLAYKDMFT